MTTWLESHVTEMLQACGMRKPERIAGKIVELIEQEQRDERIYELRATLPATQIAVRYQLTRRQVERIVKDLHKRAA